MRRITLFTALILVTALAVPAVAKRVVNESHTELQIQAYMGSENSDGGAWAIEGSNGSALGIEYSAGYDCEGAGPDDLAWESVHGEAGVEEFTVEPTNGKNKFSYGFATGSFFYGSYDWQECDGDQGSFDLTTERITIEMNGEGGSLVKTSGTSSWHIPSETNNHRNDKGTMRMAMGTVHIPGGIVDFNGEGSIGTHSWSEHTNE